jgi:hypothetical protein
MSEIRRDWSQVQQLFSLMRDILSPKDWGWYPRIENSANILLKCYQLRVLDGFLTGWYRHIVNASWGIRGISYLFAKVSILLSKYCLGNLGILGILVYFSLPNLP